MGCDGSGQTHNDWNKELDPPTHRAGTSPENRNCKFRLDFSHQVLWILPPNLTSRLSPLCLPRHWAGLSAHYMSPGLVSLPPASNPSSRPQLISIHPPPCYRSLLLKLHYVAPPLPPLKLFTGSLWADPIKPWALSMSRDCGVWLLLSISPASLLPTSLSTPHPTPTPPAPPSSFWTESETWDTALQGCGYQGLMVVKITWSCLKHKLLGYILTWFWSKGPVYECELSYKLW